MNIVISFAGLDSGSPSRPYALRRLAGGTILSHILAHLLDLPFTRLFLLVEGGQDQIQNWAAESLPDVPLQTIVVTAERKLLTAVEVLDDALRSQPLLFVSGHTIAEADYGSLTSAREAACCLIQSDQDESAGEEITVDANGLVVREGARLARWAGSCWFEDGADLLDAVKQVQGGGSLSISQLLDILLEQGLQASTERADYCLDTRAKEDILYANARLLRLNHGSEDAIERSYAEDFTVLPPVFLHETAVIENSVIGPFVNLEANASVRNSIVRNTLVGEGAQLTNVVLDSSLIGENAVITGHSKSIVVDEEGRLEL